MATSSKTPKTPTSAKAWRGKRSVEPIELELPSGNVCLVKPMSIPAMLSSGVLGDSLLPIVQGHMDKAKGKAPADFKKKSKKTSADGETLDFSDDPAQMTRIFEAIDQAIPSIVMEPVVLFHKDKNGFPIPVKDRDENALYVDEVDFEDKIFIFNFMVGGTSDEAEFREESSAAVERVQAGEEL